MSGSLRGPAERLGIETHYWDVKGQQHAAGDDSLRSVMLALGVPLDEGGDADAAVDAFFDGVGAPVTNPIVVWGDNAMQAQVSVGPRHRTITCTLRLDDGTVRKGRFTVDNLPVVDHIDNRQVVNGGSDNHLVVDTGPGVALLSRPGEDVRTFALPGPFPVGYHQLVVERGVDAVTVDVIVAPRRVARLGVHDRWWGLFAPVYALPGGTGLGANIGSLGALARAVDGFGGKIVGTLPLLASYLNQPYDPSPYTPVSRRFWNELFIDLARLPELDAVPAAAENLDGLRNFGHAANAVARSFDYRHQHGYVRGVLEQIVAAESDWPAGLQDGFAEFLHDHPDVLDYARFRAFGETQGSGWHAWPDRQRAGHIADADMDPAVANLHAFGQYAMARDLDSLQDEMSRRSQRLYLDLPLGAHGEGYDTWKDRSAFAWGMGAGAPPDDFFSDGQNWGFPPLQPFHATNENLWHFRSVIRHHMAVAGILRLDHAMCLERLFWVPDGHGPRDGIYVRYPREAMLAILAVESTRTGCIVVGEDLGTVTDSVREAMAEHGLLGMYVAEFAQPSWSGAPLESPRARQLASIDTHDTPTFTGWLHALDVDRRHVWGQIDDDEAEQCRAERQDQASNLVTFLTRRGDIAPSTPLTDELALLEGILRFLGDSNAPAVLVSIDDLVGERNPQNVPGTNVDRPNWVQRVPLSPDELRRDPGVARVLDALQGCRLGSHLRSRGESDGPKDRVREEAS